MEFLGCSGGFCSPATVCCGFRKSACSGRAVFIWTGGLLLTVPKTAEPQTPGLSTPGVPSLLPSSYQSPLLGRSWAIGFVVLSCWNSPVGGWWSGIPQESALLKGQDIGIGVCPAFEERLKESSYCSQCLLWADERRRALSLASC